MNRFKITPSGPTCRSCPLQRGSCAVDVEGFAVPHGQMVSGVMLVSDALDSVPEGRDKPERVLLGPGGYLLQRAAARKGWKLSEQFRMTSALFCHPSEPLSTPKGMHSWAADALLHCGSNLDAEILTSHPKAFVALGQSAFTALTGLSLPVTTEKDSARGYVFKERKGRGWVVPSFDLDWVQKGNQVYIQIVLADIEKAMWIAREGFEYVHPKCLLDPPEDLWAEFVHGFLADTSRPLALDTETPWSKDEAEDELEVDAELTDPAERDISYQIDRWSFAYEIEGGEVIGASVANDSRYLAGIRQLVEGAL